MSAAYRPVQWNRQKRRYDRILAGLMALYLVLFSGLQLAVYPLITPETLIIRATGTLAFLMLHVILCIGPLARLDRRLLPLLYNRRHLGVAMFLVALVHGLVNIGQFHALGNVDPLLSVFVSNTHYGSVGLFPFQVLGFFALLILFVMAAISHDFWLNNLGPKLWKRLHMLVYAAYALLLFHVLLGVVQLEQSPAWIGLPVLGFVTIATLHLTAAQLGRRRAREQARPANGTFAEVCHVDDIADNRARIVQVGGQDIAIFKYNGCLSAVSNRCRHQHGPLGEGKIVDGCITCPWHGYQYQPHDGRAPAPFTEKLETYDVRIEQGRVYVNPNPYEPGTARPPAVIASPATEEI